MLAHFFSFAFSSSFIHFWFIYANYYYDFISHSAFHSVSLPFVDDFEFFSLFGLFWLAFFIHILFLINFLKFSYFFFNFRSSSFFFPFGIYLKVWCSVSMRRHCAIVHVCMWKVSVTFNVFFVKYSFLFWLFGVPNFGCALACVSQSI